MQGVTTPGVFGDTASGVLPTAAPFLVNSRSIDESCPLVLKVENYGALQVQTAGMRPEGPISRRAAWTMFVVLAAFAVCAISILPTMVLSLDG
jgi:hypothetical protein